MKHLGQCGGMFKQTNKCKIDVWTSGLDFESNQGVGDEPLSFHLAGSVLLLGTH